MSKITSSLGETDRLIEAAVRKHTKLDFHVNKGNNHCVELVGRERKGSLWITPRRHGYRVQTTGQAQSLDPYIEEACGRASGFQKSQVYQYWNIDNSSVVERIIDRFAKLA